MQILRQGPCIQHSLIYVSTSEYDHQISSVLSYIDKERTQEHSRLQTRNLHRKEAIIKVHNGIQARESTLLFLFL